jgi:ABC transporter substrate binding protein
VGQNIDILNRYAETHYDRLPQLAADLKSRGVSIVLARGTPLVARAAMAASATLPIVFVTRVDPVEAGLVVSPNRPSGNATGVTVFMNDLMEKRLQLLHEIVPAARSIGLLDNSSYPEGKIIVAAPETGARALGVRLLIAKASTPSEIERAFAELVRQGIGGLLALPEIFFDEEHNQIAALAATYRIHRIPVWYYSRERGRVRWSHELWAEPLRRTAPSPQGSGARRRGRSRHGLSGGYCQRLAISAAERKARTKSTSWHFVRGLGNTVTLSAGTLKFYIDHLKQCTIACRDWQPIWFVARSQ